MLIADYHDQFAELYDTFYQSRDVQAEARLAVDLLELDGWHRPRRRVLDFGCGTGAHVLAFAALGIDTVGFDPSPAMIARARQKRPARPAATVRFETGTFAEFFGYLNGTEFDGAVSFFNALNCVRSEEAMVTHLRLIRSRLVTGARALMDVWNGSAVLADAPRSCLRRFPMPGKTAGQVVRITEPQLDRGSQTCTLRYRVFTRPEYTNLAEDPRYDGPRVDSHNSERPGPADAIEDSAVAEPGEFESIHELKFLTPAQYRELFAAAGFAVAEEFPKNKPGQCITDHDWYISYLLRGS